MLKRNTIILLVSGMLVAVPTAYSSDAATMSDSQHRKTMSGLHHPEQGDDANKQDKESPTMSNAQHRKTMGGMRHPDGSDHDVSHEGAAKKSPTMSDAHHRKTMSGNKHQYHESTDNPED